MTLKRKNDKPVPAYSEGMVNSIFENKGNGKPSLLCYSFNELVLINQSIKRALTKIRAGCTKSELLIPIEIIFMVICGKISNFEQLNILTSKDIISLEGYYYYG